MNTINSILDDAIHRLVATMDDPTMVDALIKLGAPYNCDPLELLWVACRCNRPNTVRYLLDNQYYGNEPKGVRDDDDEMDELSLHHALCHLARAKNMNILDMIHPLLKTFGDNSECIYNEFVYENWTEGIEYLLDHDCTLYAMHTE